MNSPDTTTSQLDAAEPAIHSENMPISQALQNHLIFSCGKGSATSTERDWYAATANTVRDHMIDRWVKTRDEYRSQDPKRIYYLSLEFLIGRMLSDIPLRKAKSIREAESLAILSQ